MNAKLKYLLGGATFLICVGIGFFVTRTIKGSSSETNFQQQVVEEPLVKETVKEIKDTIPPVLGNNAQEKPMLEKPVKIVSTVVKKMGDEYTLQVTCADIPDHISIVYEIPDLKMKNSDGYFIRIPGRKSGSYMVNVTNSSTGEKLASKLVSGFEKVAEEPKVDLMSSGEFQSLLLNQGDNSLLGGKHPKVAKSVVFTFEGLQEGDKIPGDVLAIREKISFGIWSSAKVLWVGYDEKGRINSAKIKPIY